MGLHPKNWIDWTGTRVNMLTVIRLSDEQTGSNSRWLCRCDCGKETNVSSGALRRQTSCGCHVIKYLQPGNNRKHMLSRTPIYRAWSGLRSRCSGSHPSGKRLYVPRGITFCERWSVFENFLADMGPHPGPGYSLDRIDNEGPYSPENCRWATATQQARNIRTNRMVEYRGKTQCLAAWCEELGLTYSNVRTRLHRGLSIEDAFAPTPKRRLRTTSHS